LFTRALLGLKGVFVGKLGGAFEGLGRLLEPFDSHIRKPDLDQFLDVDLVRRDVAFVENVRKPV